MLNDPLFVVIEQVWQEVKLAGFGKKKTPLAEDVRQMRLEIERLREVEAYLKGSEK